MDQYTQSQNYDLAAGSRERFDWDCQFDVDIVSADEIEAKNVIGSTYEVEITQIVRTTMTTVTTGGTLLSAGVDVLVTLTTDRHNPASWLEARAIVYQNIPKGYVGIRFHKYPQNLETDSGEPVTPTTMAQLLHKRLSGDNDWKEKLLNQLAPLTPEYVELLLPSVESQVNPDSSVGLVGEPTTAEVPETSDQPDEQGADKPSPLASAIQSPPMDEPQVSETKALESEAKSNDEWVCEDAELDSLSFDDDLDEDIEQTVQSLEASFDKPSAPGSDLEMTHAESSIPEADAEEIDGSQHRSIDAPDNQEGALTEQTSATPEQTDQSSLTTCEARDSETAVDVAPEVQRITLETDSGPDLEFDGHLLGSMKLNGSEAGGTELYQTRGGTLIVRYLSGRTEVYSSDAHAEVFEIFGYSSAAKAMYRAGGLRCVRWID